MRYLEAKILYANKDNDKTLSKLQSISDKSQNISIISPKPRSYLPNGKPVFEEHPSASYLPEAYNGQPLIKEHTEDSGYNEISFIKDQEGIDYSLAKKLSMNYINSDSIIKFDEPTKNIKYFQRDDLQDIAKKYNWNEDVLKKLKLYKVGSEEFTIPIINNGVILNTARYNPKLDNKWVYQKSDVSKGGLIFNYDNWIHNQEPTIICEGAKDMLTLLSLGYNAISITHGASTTPEFNNSAFINPYNNKPREIIIIYDFDDAGRKGARNLANWLWDVGVKNIKIVNLQDKVKNISVGEDIYDFFNKYWLKKEDLDELISKTNHYTEEDYLSDSLKKYMPKSIKEAFNKENIRKEFQTQIVVKSISTDASWELPRTVVLNYNLFFKHNTNPIQKQEPLVIDIADRDLFNYMIPDERQNQRFLRFIPKDARDFKKEFIDRETVYLFAIEQTDKKGMSVGNSEQYESYSLATQLKPNTKYNIIYTIIPNPNNQNELIVLIKKSTPIFTIEDGFSLNTSQVADLRAYFCQKENETVTQAIEKQMKSFDGVIGQNIEKQRNLWLVNELTYNSVARITIPSGKDINGMLVSLIYGDSGFGKSYFTNYFLKELYHRGKHLQANNVTDIALVGGSRKTKQGHYVTVSGALKEQDGGLIIMEELTHKASILKSITDSITSGSINILRVAGEANYQAFTRWLFISNTKTGRRIHQEKNGVIPLKTLLPAQEWMRRFDISLAVSIRSVLKDDLKTQELPMSSKEVALKKKAIPKEHYDTKIKWVWSRKKENVKISDETYQHTSELANNWCLKYGNLDFVGENSWLVRDKLLKIACATACMLFSTSDGDNLLVTNEHIDFAYQTLVDIYDNDIFKLANYVKEIKKYNETSTESKNVLQVIYDKNVNQRDFIQNLYDIGIGEVLNPKDLETYNFMGEKREFNEIYRHLIRNGFIQNRGKGILLTEKFINTYLEINKDNELLEKSGDIDI